METSAGKEVMKEEEEEPHHGHAKPLVPDGLDTQLYALDTQMIQNVLVQDDVAARFKATPPHRLRSKSRLQGSDTKSFSALQALPPSTGALEKDGESTASTTTPSPKPSGESTTSTATPSPKPAGENPTSAATPSPKPTGETGTSVTTPSPKPTVPVDFTPPKKVFTREDQLALKADGQSILPDRPVDWTTELESDMWEEYGKFKLEQQKRARSPAHEVAEESSKKAPRAQGSDGRPVIFARRYLPTSSKGKLLWESLVDAFADNIAPLLPAGTQTKQEESFLHLVAWLLKFVLSIFESSWRPHLAKAAFWTFGKAFCNEASEEDMPRMAGKAARKFIKRNL